MNNLSNFFVNLPKAIMQQQQEKTFNQEKVQHILSDLLDKLHEALLIIPGSDFNEPSSELRREVLLALHHLTRSVDMLASQQEIKTSLPQDDMTLDDWLDTGEED